MPAVLDFSELTETANDAQAGISESAVIVAIQEAEYAFLDAALARADADAIAG